MRGEVGEVQAAARPQAQHEESAEHEEDADRRDLDAGEPVLELAVAPHREQVRTVISSISPRASTHKGRPTHGCRILAPATASKPTTMTQKYQYSQPTAKPAQPPSAVRA